jgi:hypothetical protein
VQLLVLRFTRPDLQGKLRSDLDQLGDNDLVRVIDALGVRKGVDSEVEVLHNSQLGADQQPAFGALVGGLLVLAPPGRRASGSEPSATPRRYRARPVRGGGLGRAG